MKTGWRQERPRRRSGSGMRAAAVTLGGPVGVRGHAEGGPKDQRDVRRGGRLAAEIRHGRRRSGAGGLPVRVRRGDDVGSCARRPDDQRVEEVPVDEHQPGPRPTPWPARPSWPWTRSAMLPGRPARGRRRTSRPRPRAAPARCRCSRWPSRAGCAARGPAAPAGRPAGRRRRPTARPGGPGRFRSRPGPHRDEGGVRSAVPQRDAEALEHPTATSAPHSPGGVSSVRPSRSVATVTRAPRACASSMSAARSRIAPEQPGYCCTRPKNSPRADRVEVADSTSMPERRRGCAAHPSSGEGSRRRRRPGLPTPRRGAASA